MTSTSRIDEGALTVLLDVRHPQAYLALHPALELARESGVDVDWLPIAAQPLNAPSDPAADDDRGVRHRRYRAQAIAREIEAYSAAQGLVVRDYYRSPDPAGANLAWLWVRERHPDRLGDFLIETFRRYWAIDLDVSDPTALTPVLRSLDADDAGFMDWAKGDGPAAAATLAEELTERGLTNTPAYLIDGEMFWGRQHLPMVRWILGGRTGPRPI